MRPPPPPNKIDLQGVQGPAARQEEAAAPQSPTLGSAPIQGGAEELPQTPEPRRKRDFKLFAWVLTIAGCGLIVLVIGMLAIRVELGHELRQLIAEYEAKKRELVTEYNAKKRELETELRTKLETEEEAQKRELATEYEAKKRDLVSQFAAKAQELAAEYQTKKDQNDTETREAIAEYKHREEQFVAEYVRKLEAMHGPNGVSADPQKNRNHLRHQAGRASGRCIEHHGRVRHTQPRRPA